MSPKTIGLVVFPEVALAELSWTAETFNRANIPTSDGYGCRCYKLITIGPTTEPCGILGSLMVKPDVDFQNAPELDTLIVCGGEAVRGPTLCKKLAKWLTYRAPTTRRIAALGTGIYPLATTGLLDRREVATHWRLAKDVAARFPGLRVYSDRLFVQDGPFFTCAGGTATVDFALSLLEADFGRTLALKLARELVVHIKRFGSEEQYSKPLQFQTQTSDRFGDLAAWILCHLEENLTVEALAQRVCMSRRNFARLFKQKFGKTPVEFVQGARMTEARKRLLAPRTNIESVATSLGFRRISVFSDAFERFVGTRPSVYRARLGIEAARNDDQSRHEIESSELRAAAG